jgi:hypothetical protein
MLPDATTTTAAAGKIVDRQATTTVLNEATADTVTLPRPKIAREAVVPTRTEVIHDMRAGKRPTADITRHHEARLSLSPLLLSFQQLTQQSNR